MHVTLADGLEKDLFVDGQSFLLAAPVHAFGAAVQSENRFGDYRPVNGVLFPFIVQEVKIATGRFVTEANELGDEVQLILDDGSERRVDHVLLCTGYRVNISEYKFLSPELISQVQQLDGYPDVGPGFETSVPGLYFVGATAARRLGPLMYFVTGTEFTSKELASCIRRNGKSK